MFMLQVIRKFKNKCDKVFGKHGAVMIEFVLTIPIILNIIFFGFELVKIYLTQTAISKICKECTLSLISTGNVLEFDEIFQKNLPGFCKIGRSRYYCRVYSDLNSMIAKSPHGGERLGFPDDGNEATNTLPTINAMQSSFGLGNGEIILNGDANLSFSSENEVGHENRVKYLTNETPSGHSFVLTVVYRHEFSSALVKVLFGGGSNTSHHDVYMIWSRSSGIVDKRKD
jgi:hypothetical protein